MTLHAPLDPEAEAAALTKALKEHPPLFVTLIQDEASQRWHVRHPKHQGEVHFNEKAFNALEFVLTRVAGLGRATLRAKGHVGWTSLATNYLFWKLTEVMSVDVEHGQAVEFTRPITTFRVDLTIFEQWLQAGIVSMPRLLLTPGL